MTLQSGLGDQLWVDGFDVGGDTSTVQTGSPLMVQDNTPITLSAVRRRGLLRDGLINYGAFWNPGAAADTAHSVHASLPTADRSVTYCRGAAYGSHAASMIGKQINYDPTRPNDGSFTLQINALGSGYGLDWGQLLTPGKLTQGAAGNGTSVDLGSAVASYDFGWAAYLHVFAFTGTSVTVKIQDSADNSAWADLSGAVFAAATAVGSERITAGPTSTATVRRYVRIVSTGTFSDAVFGVNFVRYEEAGHQ